MRITTALASPANCNTLAELGLFKIDLHYDKVGLVDKYGNAFRYRAEVWDEGGHGHDMCYDVVLQIQISPGGK